MARDKAMGYRAESSTPCRVAALPQQEQGLAPRQERPSSGAARSSTYTKFNKKTRRYYSGRTSMVVDLSAPLGLQADLAVALRNMNHHADENIEPKGMVFDFAEIDVFDIGSAVDYTKRYDDPAYWRIRGREQQLIDLYGGAQSDTGKPYQTENVVRAVAKDNPLGRRFHDAATARWGHLHHYTGY